MFMILIFITMLVLSGCTQPLNDRITLGGQFTPPTFQDIHPTPTINHNPQLLNSVSRPRTSWKTTQYIAPLDGVVHTFEMVIPSTPNRRASPRIYGRFPTINDALDPQTTPWVGDVFYAFIQFGRSFIGTPYAIAYMTITGDINEPVFSPHENWKRTASNTWSTGFPAATPAPQEDTPHEH